MMRHQPQAKPSQDEHTGSAVMIKPKLPRKTLPHEAFYTVQISCVALQLVSGCEVFLAFFETPWYDMVSASYFYSICTQLETGNLLRDAVTYLWACGITFNVASLVTSPGSWHWPKNERY